MMLRPFKLAGRDDSSWPVLSLLLVVVLVPTLGVLWFMSQAMQNERLAVRQKLREVYQARLIEARNALETTWRGRLADLGAGARPGVDGGEGVDGAQARFARRVRAGEVDAVLFYGDDGGLLYPVDASPATGAPRSSGPWLRAGRLERSGQLDAAATAYGRIAGDAGDPSERARALVAASRVLHRAGRTDDAVRRLVDDFDDPALRDARDRGGRLLAPSARLRALELVADPADPRYAALFDGLRRRLDDYAGAPFPPNQRLFLMRRLLELPRDGGPVPVFETLDAEQLAAAYRDAAPPAATADVWQALPADAVPGHPALWHAASPDRRAVAVLTAERLRRRVLDDLRSGAAPEGTALGVLAPGEPVDGGFLVTAAAGAWLPEWTVTLKPLDQDLFDASAAQQIRAYVLIGGLVILVFVLVALLALRLVGRQLHLTRLKNDLLSTVSHELRTPLASMRLLLDTLLMAEPGGENAPEAPLDPARRREYLQMISAENARLSRLVESFLTFSKLDRRDHRFAKRRIDPRVPAEDAATAVAERFAQARCGLELDLAGDLPSAVVDPEALTTALVNLLDNACKYSADADADDPDLEPGVGAAGGRRAPTRAVRLGLRRDGEHLAYSVTDRGIGIPRAELGRIFNRFYQVDRRLQRRTDGTGLGLAIVKAIADAHRGGVDVESRIDRGSTFTLRVPIEGAR
ncbi:MAG: ATP-binding protein [Acidobacteriota bacterium]